MLILEVKVRVLEEERVVALVLRQSLVMGLVPVQVEVMEMVAVQALPRHWVQEREVVHKPILTVKTEVVRVLVEDLLSPMVEVEEAEAVKVEELEWEVMVEVDREMELQREMDPVEELVKLLVMVKLKGLEMKRKAPVLLLETQSLKPEVKEKVAALVAVKE